MPSNPAKILLALLPEFWPNSPPLGLAFLQSFLQSGGLHAQIRDYNNLFYRGRDSRLPDDPARPSFESAGGFLTNYLEEMADNDIIGFSCYRSNLETTLFVARQLRAINKKLVIVLGGPEMLRQYFIGKRKIPIRLLAAADFIVVGEGEKPLLEIMQGRKNEKVTLFQQIDTLEGLPACVHDGICFGDYPRPRTLPVQFSRGCIRACAFCAERLLVKGFRTRPVDSLIAEIVFHRTRNNINHLAFFDSLLNGDLIKLDELCGALIANLGGIAWEAQIAVRPEMEEKLLVKMKESGCCHLFVGLESGSDETLARMKKGYGAYEASVFFKKLYTAGISFGISLITGFPGETDEDFRMSLDFVLRHRDYIPKIEQLNPYVWYEGTARRPVPGGNLLVGERMHVMERSLRSHGFRMTRAFVGNLVGQ